MIQRSRSISIVEPPKSSQTTLITQWVTLQRWSRRRVIALAPDHYAAHANLATALYSQKLYSEALAEYDWILRKKPDLAVAYYFIATAHDNLEEYPEALVAYETFMARADAKTNQLEIEKVKLRLPSLRRQIQLGEGAKRKPGKVN